MGIEIRTEKSKVIVSSCNQVTDKIQMNGDTTLDGQLLQVTGCNHFSSSSSAVFFKKVGCHASSLLLILSQSLKVVTLHSRPLFDVSHPLRSSPSSSYFLFQSTFLYHVTKVRNSFLYCLNYVKVFPCHFCAHIYFICFQDIFIISRYANISNDWNFVIFLVVIVYVIVYVSHPYERVDHIRFLIIFVRYIVSLFYGFMISSSIFKTTLVKFASLETCKLFVFFALFFNFI